MLSTILLVACAQSLDEIASTLRAATDKTSYESGAIQAAKSLADMRSDDAEKLRIELFDAKGVYVRDWLYTGYIKSTSHSEGDLMLAAAANKKASSWHRVILLRGIERSKVKVSGNLLLNKNFLKDGDVCRAWQQCAGVLLKESRIDFSGSKTSSSDKLIELFDKAGAPFHGYAYLDSLTDKQQANLVDTALKGKDSGDRAIAIRVLAQQAPANINLIAIAQKSFDSNAAGPRAAVLESVVTNEIFIAAPLLIKFLKDEVAAFPDFSNRFIPDIGNSLRKLTGLSFGNYPAMWEKWWDGSGAAWLAEAKKGNKKDNQQNHKQAGTVAQFFGIPIDSSNVAILVDGSGSMSTSQLNGESCAEAAATEVGKFLAQLPKKALFTVATIEHNLEFAFKKLVVNSHTNRKKALGFLAKRPYRSASALYDALEQVALDPRIDTVLIVSDGGSSTGKHFYTGHILDGFERMYLRTGLRIHCVLVTDNTKREGFLRDLAAASGGRMVKP
jgi:hypothetical protein